MTDVVQIAALFTICAILAMGLFRLLSTATKIVQFLTRLEASILHVNEQAENFFARLDAHNTRLNNHDVILEQHDTILVAHGEKLATRRKKVV